LNIYFGLEVNNVLAERCKQERSLSAETIWFAVQSKPHRENLGAASASNLGVEVFLPRIKQEQLVCGVPREVIKPLFTGYFFARFCPSLLLDSVRHARGVLRVVGSGTLPVPVDEAIISTIRESLRADGFFRLESAVFQPGDQVVIEQGALAGWIGQVEREWDDGKRVLLLLETVLQPRLLVEKRWLTLAAAAV
jgi:transcriptional antiterminator RfaH